MATMIVFAFVNNEHDDGYYISSDRDTMDWRKLPYDLEREMEDIRRKGEEVKEVSIGLNGDWFLRTSARRAWKTEHERARMTSNVEKSMQLVQQAGLSLSDYAIQSFTFVPDATGYVVVLNKTDGSLTRCSWKNVPPELDRVLEREGQKGVRHVTVGANGAYVVILNSGAVLWGAGVPGRLHQLLEDARRRRLSVAAVSLSLVQPNQFFIQFADGATHFDVPPDWHQSVHRYSAKAIQTSRTPKIATSYGHDAPSPQQPVYNINIHNNPVPQQQQEQQQSSTSKYSNVLIRVLKGALSCAAPVIRSELTNELKKDKNSSNGNNLNSSNGNDWNSSNGNNWNSFNGNN